MKIEDDEYEVVGFVKKICICEKCNVVMEKNPYIVLESNPPKYEMKCPKCGNIDYIECDLYNGALKLVKNIEEEK